MRFQRGPFKSYYASVLAWKCCNSLIRLSFVFFAITSSSPLKHFPFRFVILFLAIVIFYKYFYPLCNLFAETLFCISVWGTRVIEIECEEKQRACGSSPVLARTTKSTSSPGYWIKQYRFRELECVLVTCFWFFGFFLLGCSVFINKLSWW